MSQPKPLEPIRQAITQLDNELLQLLARRRNLSLEVAQSKADTTKPVRDSERENLLLTRLVNEGRAIGLDGQYISRLFHTIIEDSVLRQQAWFQAQTNPEQPPITKVAYLGAKGSYSYLAAQHYFGRQDRTLVEMGMDSFEAVFQAVEEGRADHAILPLENTSSGSINEVFDLLQHTNLHIVGETTETIAHCLLMRSEAELSQVRTLYAHPQVHTQCSRFISQLDNVKQIYCASSAEAMAMASQDPTHTSAAIGSERGGEIYGLTVKQTNLANQPRNETRFFVLARKPVTVPPQVPAKTTLLMATSQKPGALVEALLVLREHGINMTKLESRPIYGNPWEEMFYLDVEANLTSEAMQRTLTELTRITRFIKVLGCYPCDTIRPTELANHTFANDVRLTASTLAAENASEPAQHTPNAPLYSRAHKAEDSPLSLGSAVLSNEEFAVLAGPTKVESSTQLRTLASALKEQGASGLSAILDPHGESQEQLTGLREASQQAHLPLLLQVQTPEQVRRAAPIAQMLWFAPEQMHDHALLRAVGHTQTPVLLSRHPKATLEQWLEAAEVILQAGNQQVVLVETGKPDHNGQLRLDLLNIAELKTQTHLPILIAPMATTEAQSLLLASCQAARSLGARGALLSVDHASDLASQQLTVSEFAALMNALYQS